MPRLQSGVLPKKLLAKSHEKRSMRVSQAVVDTVALDAAGVYARLKTRPEGLTADEAEARLAEHGQNILAKDQRPSFLRLLWRAVINPLVILLAVLATVSFATGDARAATMMLLMITLSVGLKLFQEAKANDAATKLKAMISVKATVLRGGAAQEIPVSHLVPGDVVQLAAGDMIPGDVRVVSAKDLFVVQGSLTGESFPVEKFVVEKKTDTSAPLELTSIAFLGTSVGSGAATAVVVATGKDTYLGGMAEALQEHEAPTAFDRGITHFTMLMLGFMGVMVPLVFVINGVTKGTWREAFFFALAVAVGLTPEMLPMIVTICLSKGAVAMGKKKVIVKRINAIQNLGAMDILCADKTGTLTRDEIILERHCDVTLRENEDVLALAYINSHFQTGLKNVLDRAILKHEETHAHARVPELVKVDEIPFDFERRIMSVVVRTPEGSDRIISKGAPEAIFEKCTNFRLDGKLWPMDHPHIESLKKEYERLSADGFRVLALATKDGPPHGPVEAHTTPYGKADECELVLEGYVAFLDPPKESALAAIAALGRHGVVFKVITGDNELVARKVCSQVGLSTDRVLLGDAVEKMTEEELAKAAEDTVLFARVSPAHKQRIIKALRSRKHTVGFMGDGINDAPALHAADVGISVDTAVDIAKESADMILLEKSLLVLDDGVLEGRKVFSNIIKYVRMGASSNFGNMFSVLGASVFVPFLPMRPIQILANNLLYDVGQTAIPTDAVDVERIQAPRAWDIKELTRFILFIGPCSSIFDYTTYFLMLYVFKCWNVSTPEAAAHSESLFQTGWFVESLLTQTLIIHVIRTNKIPFLQSRPSPFLLVTSVTIMAIGVVLPFTVLGRYLGFTALPPLYWPYLALTLLCYVVLTQGVKAWLLRLRWI
ncbi:MAG TPA: magnesium-translocating P-type ATPase [Polyangiaceae bacterium]